MNIAQIAAALRDDLLDWHATELDVHSGISSVNFASAAPGLEERLRATILWRAEVNAQFAMQLAHLLDELSEIPPEDDDGAEWKRSG